MPSPVADQYSVASGQSVWAGRWPPGLVGGILQGDMVAAGLISGGAVTALGGSPVLDDMAGVGSISGGVPSNLGGGATLGDFTAAGAIVQQFWPTVAFLGDSLTDPSYNVTPWHWALGVNGGVLAPIINSGVAGNTINNVLSRVDNSYLNVSPGLASAPEALGWVFLRIGTNDARGGAINGTIQAQFDSLIAKCLTYAQAVVIFAIPPLGGSSASLNVNVPGYNSYFAGKANGSTVFYVDGTANLKDGSGNQIAAFFNADGIHFIGYGTMQAGIDEGAGLATVLAPYNYLSPIDTSATSGSSEWHPNPQNTGTSGSIGSGFTGQLPTNFNVSANGSGNTGTCSIVATNDSLPAPWARVAPTGLGASNSSIRIALTATGRSITTIDPAVLDVVLQVRFNNFDATKITDVRTWMQDSTGGNMYGAGLAGSYLMLAAGGASIGASTPLVVVLRIKLKRPTANNASGATIFVDIRSAGSFSGSMGSVDFRYHIIKG